MIDNIKIKLGVNIDHIATLRNARGEGYPDPIKACDILLKAGADSITAHLREDRRHIKDQDIKNITMTYPGKLNLEMAANEEMLNIAINTNPFSCCIVPERREELTTEGGLDVINNSNYLKEINLLLKKKGIRTSFFIDPEKVQVESAIDCEVDCIEFHVGKFCKLFYESKSKSDLEFKRLEELCNYAHNSGIEVHLGHGLDYETTKKITEIKCIQEVNIGFFLVAQSIFDGLENTVKKMKQICERKF